MTVMDILKKSVKLQTRLLSEIMRVFNYRFWGGVLHPPLGLIGLSKYGKEIYEIIFQDRSMFLTIEYAISYA